MSAASASRCGFTACRSNIVAGDADRLRGLYPLVRVPALVLDDGFVLTDSHLILDYVDSPVDVPLFPRI